MSELLIRNDDVYQLDDKLKKFHSIIDPHDIKVIHGVIPAKLKNDEIIEYLENKENTLIAQHGYKHTNHGTKNNKYEFGNNRKYQEQHQEIKKGKQIIKEKFNNHLNCFIPPYHSFNKDTIKAAEKCNFEYFSAYHKIKYQTKLKKIDSNLIFPSDKKSDKFLLKLNNLLNSNKKILLLTHHEKFNSKNYKILKKFLQKTNFN